MDSSNTLGRRLFYNLFTVYMCLVTVDFQLVVLVPIFVSETRTSYPIASEKKVHKTAMEAITRLLIAISVTLTWVLAMKNFEVAITNEELFVLALRRVIMDAYVPQSNTIFITKSSIIPDLKQTIILDDTLTFLGAKATVTWMINDNSYGNNSMERINNIVIIDSYNSWRLISDHITPKSHSLNYFGYYTIILTQIHKDQATIVINILRDCWKLDIFNINVLTHEATGDDLILYTYFPFKPSSCGEINLVIWNYFRKDRFVNSKREMFPLKMKNFHQCPISILVCPMRPYIFVTKKYSNDTYEFDGSEYSLLDALSERLNFKPNFSVHWNPNLGNIFPNGTTTFAFAMAYHRETNITVGALIPVNNVLSPTEPYSFENLIFVVPNARPFSAFEKLFFPFRLTTWLLMSAVLMISVIVLKILEHNYKAMFIVVIGERNVSPYLNLLRVLITSGGVNAPRKYFPRLLLIMWIMTCFILQTVYHGQLFTFMKMHKMKESVQNMEELIDRNITIKSIEENFSDFLQFDERIGKLLKYIDPLSNWEYVTENEAYITMEAHLVDEAKRNIHDESVILDKPKTLKVATVSHVLYVAKRSFLKLPLDVEINSFNENGLTHKWSEPYKLAAIQDNNRNIPQKLNITQFYGILELCCGLLVAAFVIFVGEIWSFYWLNKGFSRSV